MEVHCKSKSNKKKTSQFTIWRGEVSIINAQIIEKQYPEFWVFLFIMILDMHLLLM